MNEFVSWCRHLLVSFLFHALTSLHPPSFHRNDFFHLFHSFFIHFGAKPQDVFFAQRARRLYARACARGEPTVHAHVNGVVQCQPGQSPTIYHRNVRREKNERSVSVHTSVDCGDVW